MRSAERPAPTGRCLFARSATALAIGAGLLAGCGGSGRSTAAVCRVWNSQAGALHAKYLRDARGKRGLRLLLDLVAAPGQVTSLMDNMAAAAPMSVEPSFHAVAVALHKQASSLGDSVTNPVAAAINGAVTGLAISGPVSQVDAYLKANCMTSAGP